MEELPDDELLALIARGDHMAFEELYDRHAGWLLLRLGRRCTDAGLAEEVLQDTFDTATSARPGSSARQHRVGDLCDGPFRKPIGYRDEALQSG